MHNVIWCNNEYVYNDSDNIVPTFMWYMVTTAHRPKTTLTDRTYFSYLEIFSKSNNSIINIYTIFSA